MGMTAHLIYGLFWVVPFLLERITDLLQLQKAKEPLPKELWDLQTPEQHEKSTHYSQDQKRVLFLSSFTHLLFWSLFWKFGGIEKCAEISSNGADELRVKFELFDSVFLRSSTAGLFFIGLLSIFSSIIETPFQIYSTFVIEEKYGFNRTTWKIYLSDTLKGIFLSLFLGTPILFLTFYFLNKGFSFYWIWGAYLILQTFLMFIAPVVLLPLFLKLSPLPEGELKSEIENYRKNQTFKLNGVWVCDASKRSAKSNAFFTGFGKFRRLVLFDTLIQNQTPKEITAVVAHEAGHFQKGHIIKGMMISCLMSFFFLWAVTAILKSPELFLGFNITDTSYFQFYFGLPIAVTLVGRFLYPLKLLSNALSRKHEYEADAFSIETTQDKESLMNALKKLSQENLSTVQYHPLYTALHLSHPPLPDRLKAMMDKK